MSQESDVSGRVGQGASVAADRAQALSSGASAAAQDLAGTAKDQASQVGQEVSAQARSLVEDARSLLQDHARAQNDRLGGALRDWSRQARALGEGRTEQAGQARELAGHLADRLEQAARRVQQRGLGGLVEDLQDMGRRRPTSFLLGAGALGFGVGRFLRGAKAGATDAETVSQASASGPEPVVLPADQASVDPAALSSPEAAEVIE